MKATWQQWESIGVTAIFEESYDRGNYPVFDKELFFVGGSDQDIAEMLWEHQSVAELMFTHGDICVVIEKPYGNFNIRFSRK